MNSPIGSSEPDGPCQSPAPPTSQQVSPRRSPAATSTPAGYGFTPSSEAPGPALLLIHGWPETWYAWRLLMPALAEHFTVIAVDQRGVGLSDKPTDGCERFAVCIRERDQVACDGAQHRGGCHEITNVRLVLNSQGASGDRPHARYARRGQRWVTRQPGRCRTVRRSYAYALTGSDTECTIARAQRHHVLGPHAEVGAPSDIQAYSGDVAIPGVREE